MEKLLKLNDDITRTSLTFNGQGILISKQNTTGIMIRSYLGNDIDKIELINNGIIDGNLKDFNKNTPCFCVGDATEKTAKQKGFYNTFSAGGNVRNLRELILQNLEKTISALKVYWGQHL